MVLTPREVHDHEKPLIKDVKTFFYGVHLNFMQLVFILNSMRGRIRSFIFFLSSNIINLVDRISSLK
jgi:hypothetical protein